MTLDPDHKLIAVKLLLEKSDKNMEQANANAELGYWDLVFSAVRMECYTRNFRV